VIGALSSYSSIVILPLVVSNTAFLFAMSSSFRFMNAKTLSLPHPPDKLPLNH
jgi:hypothetical protein